MKTEIRVFQTHVEVYPYTKGDWPDMEKFYSIFVTRGPRSFYKPFCYFIEGKTLYLPKGVNILSLEVALGVQATYVRTSTKFDKMSKPYCLKSSPKESQIDAIKFLTSSDRFLNTARYSQFVLQCPTSFGKTYCCIASVVRLGVKAAIFTTKETLVDHWRDEFLLHTNIPSDKIVLIQGHASMEKVISGEINGDVYVITHQSINSAVRIHGKAFVTEFFECAGIGVKVIDEVHEYLASTMKIDCITNIWKNFYLSGTLARSRYRETKILLSMFSSAASYEPPANDSSAELKLIYIQTYYKSTLPEEFVITMKGRYGFSAYKFIESSIQHDDSQAILSAIISILDKHIREEPDRYPGQILLVTPSKNSVEFFYRTLLRRYRDVGKIYSDVSSEERADAMSKRIICSTIKSCGTGFNVPNLQTVICGEPHMSHILTKQLKGRLDRYSVPGKDVYFYDLFDMNIPYFEDIQKAHLRVLKNYAKKIDTIFL